MLPGRDTCRNAHVTWGRPLTALTGHRADPGDPTLVLQGQPAVKLQQAIALFYLVVCSLESTCFPLIVVKKKLN